MSGIVRAATTLTFKGNEDRYNGITVDSTVEPCDVSSFPSLLEASLKHWSEEQRRTIWFRVSLAQSGWVPVLTRNGFKYHHAREEYATLYRWLPEDQESNIPPYAHTLLGVGAFVFNEKTREILAVKERYSVVKPMWKLPGGYLEPGEDIGDAARREVLEETGIKAEFKNLLTFRHGHQFAFGCSDIYMVACLAPQTFDIRKCDREIAECTWMKLEEFVQHPQVHEYNRGVARKFIEYLEHKTGIAVDCSLHPTLKTPLCIYSILKEDS